MSAFNADLQAWLDWTKENFGASPEQLEYYRVHFEAPAQRIRAAGITSYDELYRVIRSKRAKLEVRRAACKVIAFLIPVGGTRRKRIDKRRAVPALLAALNTDDDELRQNAIHALDRLNAKRAYDSFYKFAFEVSGNSGLRWEAITALGNLRDKRALTALANLAQDKTAGQSDRIAAILALEALRDKSTVPVLMSIIQDQDDSPVIRGEAEERLSSFHAPESVPLYITALQDKSADVRFWAAYGLLSTAYELDISAALHLLDHAVAFDEESPQGWWHVGREAMSALGCLWYPQDTTGKAGRRCVGTQTYLISPLLEYADFQRASWQREGEERRWQPLQQSTTLRLDPAWLSDQLKQQWQGIRFNVIEPQPQSLILNWEIDMPNGLLLGGLHRDGYGIMLTNRSYDDILDFAVWYRSIISPEHPLRLYEWADSGREIRPGMTVDELKG